MRADGDGRDRRLALALTGALAVAVALLLGRALVGGDALIGADQLLEREPWRAELLPEGASLSSAPAGDTFDIWDPQRQIFSDALLDGDLALWNPFPSGGAPLAAEPSTGTFSPFQLTYLALPDWYAPGLVKLLEIAACVGFTFLFLRSVGLSRVAGVTGGLVYAFNGFQLVWTNWPQTRVGALVPALFWAVERVLRRRDRPLVDGTRAAALAAVVTAILVLDGFPTVMLATLIAAGAYVVVRCAATPSIRTTGGAWVRAGALSAAGVGLGIGLAAVQLLPFLARLPLLELSRDQTPNAHFDALVAATLVAPNTFGAPQDGVFHLRGNYVESLAYVGAAACVLVVVALARRAPAALAPGVRLHAALTALVAFVLMFVGGPVLELAQHFPPLDTNNVGRLRALLAFALAVLAAIGMETVLAPRTAGAAEAPTDGTTPAPAVDGTERDAASPTTTPAPAGRVPAWLQAGRVQTILRLAVVAAAVLVAAGGVLHVLSIASDRGYLDRAREHLAVAGIIAAAATAAVLVAWRWRRFATPAVAVLGLLVVGQGFAVWQPYLPFSERDEWFARTSMHDFLERNQGHDRTATGDSTLVAGSAARYGIRMVTGHVFTQPTWRQVLRAIDPAAFARSPTLSYLASTAEVAGSPVLDRLGARFLAIGEDAEVLGEHRSPEGDPAATGEAVVVGPGDTATGAVRARRLRAVSLTLAEPLASEDDLAWLRVRLRDPGGSVIARGSRRIHGTLPAGTHTVAVAAEAATSDAPTALTVEVTLDADDGRAVLAADAQGRPVLGTVVGDDDLELVFSDHGQVYERSTALPRVRWASRARVERDGEERLALLRSGLPDDTVVLDEPGPELGDTPTGELTGGGADLDVTADGLDGVRVAVEAERPGYLVLADAVQIGWQVRVDGEPAELRHADHALGAVHVPEGRHTVEFTFRPERWGLGQVVTALSGLVLLAVVVAPTIARRRSGS